MASDKYPDSKRLYGTARQNIRNLVLSPTKPNGEIDISADYEASKAIFQHYVTLDFQHRLDLLKIRNAIRDYAFDRTRKRPLNIIMQAEPGSGKSHLVKCLAQSIHGVEITSVDYNMACLQSLDDLVQPLDSVRNLNS
jgi:ATP-dependent Clp protease ATP-binding subunit ClpA